MISFDVLVVTYDSASELPGCLASIEGLEARPRRLIAVDNASRDASLEVLRGFASRSALDMEVLALKANHGFSGGMNRALSASQAERVLTLNPDARPRPDFVTRLQAAIEAQGASAVGAATGKLLRSTRPGDAGGPTLDACGMMLRPTWRHLDRGSGEPDRGQLDRREWVFGATGAAALFVRQALDDVAIGGCVFDEDFHSFREDAELCMRLQERGWGVVYEPAAVAEHRRFNLPSRRRSIPAHINYHSLKNRYLLRAYHQTVANFCYTLPATLMRDLMALVYVLLFERSSAAAYAWLWRHRRQIRERRRLIQDRRRQALGPWFFRRGRAAT